MLSIDSCEVRIARGTIIGHFNVFRNLKDLTLQENVRIANFNEFFGATNSSASWASCLHIKSGAKVMSHHFFDVAATIIVGENSTVGGRDSQFWSHSAGYADNLCRVITPIDISIGSHVYIGARVTCIGSEIPDRSIVGAGSVITKSFLAEDHPLLIAGNPASVKKRYLASDL